PPPTPRNIPAAPRVLPIHTSKEPPMAPATEASHILSPEFLREHFEAGLPYDAYAATGNPHQQASWRAIYDQARLTDAQASMIASWTRTMPVLVSSGVWCG